MIFWKLLSDIWKLLSGIMYRPVLFFLKWWKETKDRKAKNLSRYAKKILAETDTIYTLAKTMRTLVSDSSGIGNIRTRASLLWKSGSTSVLLNNWQSYAWVLDKHRNTRSLRKRFEQVVERIRRAAVIWHKADMEWRQSAGITENECIIGGDPQKKPTNYDIAKSNATQDYLKAFDAFVKERQVIHNSLQPLIQTYNRQENET